MPTLSISRLSRYGAAFCASLAVTGAASADTLISLQPDEASSKDVFVYEFGVGGTLGIPTPPRTTNLDTVTLNGITPPPVPFGLFLGAANTDPQIGAQGEVRAHDAKTLIQFDLSLLNITAARVASASINLYALPALPPFESPDAAHPVTIDLRRVLANWGEQSATWENQPTVAASPTSTVVQGGVDQWLSFDITGLVRDWLADPASNFGVQLAQRDVVEIEVDGVERYFGGIYASSATADVTLRPYIAITATPTPVPLPPAGWLLGAALSGLGLVRRRLPSA
ncbi:MAG: DNRLRE domain-containing protein [Gammaproteobacteria bacterium]